MTDAKTATTLHPEAILDLDFSGSSLIEASAGTGKTHTIADLYLRQVLEGRLVSEILIVTFTNAATEELRGRIHSRLYQALSLVNGQGHAEDALLQTWHQRWQDLDAEQQELQKGRLQLALRSLDEAAISTIHSFCQRCLQENALAGRQFFESELLSEDDSLWEAACKDWWRGFGHGLDQESWHLLASELGSIDRLTAEMLDLRNKPSARLLPEDTLSLPELLERPRSAAVDLHRLASLWARDRKEIIETLRDSSALSRRQQLPYHGQNIEDWLAEADYFFNSDNVVAPFPQFEYMGTKWLHENSKPSMVGKDARFDNEFFTAVGETADSWTSFSATLGARLRIIALREISAAVRKQKRKQATLSFQDQLSLLLEALQSGRGDSLAASLRQQFPIAMIDEFQDTDYIQYRIFEKIYDGADNVSLTLIGDPKQSIYSFRGGDIFTYMQARSSPSVKRYRLQTNWRSQPDLVQAVNTLFSRRTDAFVFHDAIEFNPADSIPGNDRFRLELNGQAASAMTFWQLPQISEDKFYNREQMRDLVNEAVVTEIAQLLELSRSGAATIDGRPLNSGDLAILVRRASEGQALSLALHRQGIRTVSIGRDSVFHSDEARGLYDLLLAVSPQQNAVIAARSLASSLLAMDYREIAAIIEDDQHWQSWLEDLGELQRLWEQQGFIAMFDVMLGKLELTRRLARQDNSERRITNLLHLAELLREQSGVSTGASALLGWFKNRFDENGSEEAELRLENDESLVKIVTIHKSKGLQYPVVFVPFLWSCRQVDRKSAIHFHDSDFNACLDLGGPDYARHWLIAEKERLAEDLRLLYVAVTRARSRVYLAWGQAGSSGSAGNPGQTALAFLLHSRQTVAELDTKVANGFADDMDFEADLQSLVDASSASIEWRQLPTRPEKPVAEDKFGNETAPQLADFERTRLNSWRVNSFTALTRGVHQPGNSGESESRGDPVLEFPAGSHVGLLLHSVLENLDFESGLEPQCDSLFDRFLPLAGLSDQYRPTLAAWLRDILATPLNDSGLCLDKIGKKSRLNELEFDFALDQVDIDQLNRFMQSRVPQPLQAITSPDFSGLVTGVIDLVFEYRGRYYVADYKSNFLGYDLQDYAPQRLAQAMFDRRYDLQSLLYSLALHRLLKHRISNYDFESHFGGSYYLFLRAMRPALGPGYGIHFERPDRDCIETFDDLFCFTPPDGVPA